MLLDQLGIYGWGAVERFLVGSLAGRFSTLLVGGAGTAKTEGAERLFMALDRAAEIRGETPRPWGYRNASTAQIEDMTGFPLLPPMDLAWEMNAKGQTPSMIWVDSPQAVRHYHFLVADEINRIPPMLQNKWFSLIAERRIDGVETNIEAIIAAMNPVEEYEGTEPLDRAFADRFVWLLHPPGFFTMEEKDQRRIAQTRMVYHDKGMAYGKRLDDDACLALADAVADTRKEMVTVQKQQGDAIAAYSAAVVKSMNDRRIESRRVAMIAQGIVALHAATRVISGNSSLEQDALESLRHAMVHEAMGEAPPQAQLIVAAHESAKVHLIGAQAAMKDVLNSIDAPNARVGYCLAMDAESEMLSDELQAAHNHYMAQDPVQGAAFSIAALSVVREKSIHMPYKYVLDELGASVLQVINTKVTLPAASIVPGHYQDDAAVSSAIAKVADLIATSPLSDPILGLAASILDKTKPSSIRKDTSLLGAINDPTASEYVRLSRAIVTAEQVLRNHIFALQPE